MQQTPFHAYYTARILDSLSGEDGFVSAFASSDIKIYPFQIAAANFALRSPYTVGEDCLLLICLADDVRPEDVEAMAEYAPAKLIIARDSFKDDTAMANAHYILRDKGIELKLV